MESIVPIIFFAIYNCVLLYRPLILDDRDDKYVSLNKQLQDIDNTAL